MKKQVYIINGKPQSGKDTFAEFVKEYAKKDYGLSVTNLSTVDKVKQAALMLGWDGVKDDKGRKFLSDLKALSSALYDGPLNYVINEVVNGDSSIYFVHCREPEGIQQIANKLSELGIVEKTILIKNSRSEQIEYNNDSDGNVYNFNYDITINNEGTLEEFKNIARLFAKCAAEFNAL